MNAATNRIRRVVTLDDVEYIGFDSYSGQAKFAPGDIVCLVEVTDTMTGRESNVLTKQPRTNQSHELRWHGWLGTTNNVAANAKGAYRLVSLTEHDSNYMRDVEDYRYRASLVRVEDPA